jgi:hypothetical protein
LAAKIEVRAGQQMQGVTLPLAKVKTAAIRGRLVNAAMAGAQARLTMYPDGSVLNNYSMQSVSVDAKGEFEILNVTPGSYWLMGSIQMSGKSYSNRLPVKVDGTEVKGLVVTLGTPVSVTGRVVVEPDGPADLSKMVLRLEPRPRTGVGTGQPPTTRPGDKGAFRFDDLSPGHYDVLFLSGMPEGAYVKSIRAGDADVVANGLDASSGGNVEITLSTKAGEVSGTANGTGATVVLLPLERERKELAGAYFNVTADQYGHFSVKNVPPGEYVAYGWEDIEPGAWFDPDVMKPLEGKSTKITVRESSKVEVTLPVIPMEDADGKKK